MTFSPGTRLGPYEIVAPLGKGGMGEVWRAKDTRLGREVALKLLPPEFAADPERHARFEREAKLLGALNHPNVAVLYGLEHLDGQHVLAMELVEGEELDVRIGRGPIAPAEAIPIARQIASGLEAAHEKGIVHRDLKPANVKVRPDSTVKVLDFGLAKAWEEPAAEADPVASPTVTGLHTRAGMVLGTAAYMAPEQVRGEPVDKRADNWAFGVVLYEMLAGRRPFRGATQSDTFAAVLSAEVDWGGLPAATPGAARRVLGRCLERDARRRLRDIGEARIALEAPTPGGGEAAPSPRPAARGRERVAWAVAAVAVLAGAIAALLSGHARAPEELVRFTIQPPPGQSILGFPEISPDGRRILFLLQDEGGRNSIWVRSLDRLEMRRLPGTEDARGMFWSPDGREFAFFSEGRLKRIGSDGGPVETVCESKAGFSGAWNRQGTVLFTEEFGGPIVAVPATGGTPRPVTAIDWAKGDVAHFHPSFLPDGRHFVFVARNVDPEKTSVMLASLDSKGVRILFRADSAAVFADPGYLLFARDSALFAWRLDLRTLELIGEPAPAIGQVRYATEDNVLAVSAAGNRVVYLSWFGRRRLVWVDRKGRELGTLGEVGGYEDVRLSPDGRKVAVALRDPSHGQNEDVWVLDVSRGTGSRVTAEPTDEFDPAWFPDGERLAYVSDRLGFYDVYERPAGGGGAERVLVRTKHDKVLPSVSPDGRYLLMSVPEGERFTRVLAPLSGRGDFVQLSAGSRFSEEHPAISPDGRWVAFDSTESGQKEIYVQPIPGGEKRQASIGGGQMPVWSRDGSELFYAAKDGMLMSVAVRLTAGRDEIGEPQPLFLLRLGLSGETQFHRHAYDVSSDGQRFLVIRRAPDAEPDGAVVVTNWTAVLEGTR
ncbi:MAG: protein kinase [Acidobacteriia bacterium]|nr:protein kinase [Terriglobia bacterium]